MASIESTLLIYQPQHPIFNLSQDYKLRFDWDPFLTEMEFLNDAIEPEKGVEVMVKSKDGFKMTVKYIFFNPPKSVAIQMINGPFFFKKFAGSWKFEEIKDQVTRVSFRYNFELKWFALPFLMNYFVKNKFQKNIDQRLKSLKYAAEKTDILKRLEDEYVDIEVD